MAFSLQRHRPIHIGASSGDSWCTSHKATISSSLKERDDYHHRTNDCFVDSGIVQPQNNRPSFSRRKFLSSTTAGIAAGITSGIVTPQPKRAFASKGNAATSMNTNVVMGDQSVVRQYAGAFLEKMLGELATGNEKGVEHVFRNLALFLSPPVTALDGGGVPLVRLRESLAPEVVESFDALSLNGARLADAILSKIPFEGKSAHDPGRVLVASAEFRFDPPSKQVDAIFASIWATAPLEDFKAGR